MDSFSETELRKSEAILNEIEVIKAIEEFRQSPCWYFAQYYHRNSKGNPLTFKKAPFLIPIYKDDSQYKIFQKSTQCGITEAMMCYIMSKLKLGWSGFYIFPKAENRTTFSQRFDRQVEFVPFYIEGRNAQKKRVDSAILKYFWQGILKLVGSNVLSDMKEFPADIVIIEEYDQCNLENVDEARHRLDYSEHKYIIEISNPTVTNEGICERFKKSDQKYWHIKCPHCNEWQTLDWFFSVVREIGEKRYQLIDREWNKNLSRDINVYCKKCGKHINRYMDGEWIASYQDRKISGYQISQMFSGNVSILEMWNHHQESRYDNHKLQLFYNNRLGLGYEGAGAKLTHSKLDTCRYTITDQATGGVLPCTAGIDTGANACHVVIHDYPKIVIDNILVTVERLKWAGTTSLNLDEVVGVLKRNGVTCACIDSKPETYFSKQLRDAMPGIVWMIEYLGQASADGFRVDTEDHLIKVDRTSTIDEMIAKIETSVASVKDGNPPTWILSEDARTIHDGQYYNQMCAPTRKFDKDRKPRGAWVWDEGSRPDHYFHAENYNHIARGIMPISGKIQLVGKSEISGEIDF